MRIEYAVFQSNVETSSTTSSKNTDQVDYSKHHGYAESVPSWNPSPSSCERSAETGKPTEQKSRSSLFQSSFRSKEIRHIFIRSSGGSRLAYQKMDDEYHGYLNDREEREGELFAKKKSRSKSLPNNSLVEAKRQTLLKLKLQQVQQQQQHQQQQQQQQQQQLDENQQPRRRSSPLTIPLLQMGKEILSNSAKDIEYEKKRMEYVLEKQKRLQDDSLAKFNRNARRKSLNIFFGFATDPMSNSEPSTPLSIHAQQFPTSEGTFTKWKRKIHRKVSSGKNLRTAEEGHKRATRAMNAAGDWIVQMEDSLQQEERRLRERALDLRRQSVSAFKLMSDAKKGESEDDEDEDETDDKARNKLFEEKLVRFGNDYYFTEPTPMPSNDQDYNNDDTFYECLADDNGSFSDDEGERRRGYR